ncbi:tRNA pseudouridine(13) synthase TruD [Arenimonas caeni]|uniref:tRNA pseudouridine(13) synthase TruD n=1 Tax=Arenimonas caeni TaxID=2058085 RepID=UPI002A3619AD|nr:tRNA pseudouridine(13) synthase TruD [Arenimonas caeni]MDY0021253.1 tRNA pseudouridine(13) synthase TruD [Arenimonas caeni]
MSELPGGHGGPVLRAVFRAAPEDFIVEELPGFEASGEGEHLLLTIEKRGMNTVHAARCLARWAGIAEHGVGYAGLKDRHAVTRQRFTVHLPKRVAPDPAALEAMELRVLDSAWHQRKLPRGALRGNRFSLRLREVEGDPAAIDARLQAIATGGLPNYFGEQRFGRDGDNVDAARRMFAGARVHRDKRSIYLSAARSALFNAVLAGRVRAGDWAGGREGEVWMLDGSQSVFGPEPATPELAARAARLDIHPTGPLWGRGELRSAGATRELELAAVEPYADIRAGLEAAGLKQERRALRVRVGDLAWDWPAPGELALRFELPPGAYATGLLAELGEARDGSRGGTCAAQPQE